MSYSHKERHKWKKKERKRTGESDPKKIRLHRRRFLRHIEEKLFAQDGYKRKVFRTRLRFDLRAYETFVIVRGKVVGKVPYLVERVENLHHLIAQNEELDVQKEEETLAGHVSRAKAEHKKCCLEQDNGDGFCRCLSAFSCRFRCWDKERNLPECRK